MDLYVILGLEHGASESDIKRAYGDWRGGITRISIRATGRPSRVSGKSSRRTRR
jgi:hypothetical protein